MLEAGLWGETCLTFYGILLYFCVTFIVAYDGPQYAYI